MYTPPMAEKMSFSSGSRSRRKSNKNDVPTVKLEPASGVLSPASQGVQAPLAEVDDIRSVLERALNSLQGTATDISVGEMVASYMAAKRPTWKPGSLRKFELRASELVALYGAIPTRQISRDFGRRVLEDAHAPSAKRERLELLSAAWRWAMSEGAIVRPVPWGRLQGPKAHRRERYLSAAELDRFWSAVDALEPHSEHVGSFRCIRLLALTGCRVSELCSLRPSDIDWTLGLLRLADSKVGPREIGLSSRALAYLRAIKPDTWVCPRPDGTPVKQHRVRTDLHSVAKLAKLGDIGCHTLRHTWATHALLAGVPLEHVRVALGHSTTFMSSRYGHLSARDLRASLDRAADAIARHRDS